MSQIIKPSGGSGPPGDTAIFQINSDSGYVTGNIVTIYADQAANNSGATVAMISNAGHTITTLNVTDANSNTIVGNSSGNAIGSNGGSNTFFGADIASGGALTSGSFANACLASEGAFGALTTGTNNTGIGWSIAAHMTTGSFNTFLGQNSGNQYTTSEGGNVLIANQGVTGETGVIRIGTQGTYIGTSALQNTCYIAGINGVTTSNSNMVTINTATGQLGAAAIPSGSGTVTSVSGTANQVAVATGTTTPVISLVGPYTPATYGAHTVLIGEGTSSIVGVGPGSSGQILQSGGASGDPAYSTSTYPSTNAANTLLYASTANVMAALATADNGVLITSSSGAPSILAAGTTGQVLTATTGSPPTWASPIVLYSSINLSAAQVNALNGTPQTIVAAVSGQTIVIVAASVKYTFGSAAFVTTASTIEYQINGVTVTGVLPTTFLALSASNIYYNWALAAAQTATLSTLSGQAMTVNNPGTNTSTGTGAFVRFEVIYYLI
jgi:hypothetical protein